MAKWNVYAEQECEFSIALTVEADSQEEAEKLAQETLEDTSLNDWEWDDTNSYTVSVTPEVPSEPLPEDNLLVLPGLES